jgi:acetate CoA/acetoacetate CoA-transferase alpha subunit
MAYAGDVVIAEPNEIVPTGVIPPDSVVTPHVLVDYLIERRQRNGR